MFTVRVEDRVGGGYRVYECARYSVTYDEASRSAALPLEARMVLNDGGPDQHEVVVCDGARAFVMNHRGDTVDTIRTRTPQPSSVAV